MDAARFHHAKQSRGTVGSSEDCDKTKKKRKLLHDAEASITKQIKLQIQQNSGAPIKGIATRKVSVTESKFAMKPIRPNMLVGQIRKLHSKASIEEAAIEYGRLLLGIKTTERPSHSILDGNHYALTFSTQPPVSFNIDEIPAILFPVEEEGPETVDTTGQAVTGDDTLPVVNVGVPVPSYAVTRESLATESAKKAFSKMLAASAARKWPMKTPPKKLTPITLNVKAKTTPVVSWGKEVTKTVTLVTSDATSKATPASSPESKYEDARREVPPIVAVTSNEGMASIARKVSGTENWVVAFRTIFEMQLVEMRKKWEELAELAAERVALQKQNAMLVSALGICDGQQAGFSAAPPPPVFPIPPALRMAVASPTVQIASTFGFSAAPPPPVFPIPPALRMAVASPTVRIAQTFHAPAPMVENEVSHHKRDHEDEEYPDRGRAAMAVSVTRPSKIDRCFNCGLAGHKAPECTTGYGERRCYKCNGIGHIARDCEIRGTRQGSQRAHQGGPCARQGGPCARQGGRRARQGGPCARQGSRHARQGSRRARQGGRPPRSRPRHY